MTKKESLFGSPYFLGRPNMAISSLSVIPSSAAPNFPVFKKLSVCLFSFLDYHIKIFHLIFESAIIF